MRKQILIIALSMIILGCEDNKKAAETEEINIPSVTSDTIVETTEKEEVDKPSYPFLTNENVE
ncbi:MAG TPA: hypothetical protein VFD80_04895, partial [Flavobacteriaceae bacterium]|nr:hypothetical protein [Flavobacteriaceae bacterium]